MQASLSAEEKESVRNVCGMGFPAPRVARAIKRCEGDNQKVGVVNHTNHDLLAVSFAGV